MKKIIATVAVLALTLALGTTAFAASQPASRAFADAGNDGICDNYGTHPHFVDADNDGVCDNRSTRCTSFVDADNDGICDNHGTHPHFVDADGDGICDNRGTRCTSFVDSDNDGICDNCDTPHTRNNANHSNGCIGACASGSGHGYGRNHH